MLVKLRFYYRACDFAQNGVSVEKVTMILQPVKSDVSFEMQQILYQNVGEEEGAWRPKLKLSGDFSVKIITPLGPKNSKNSKRTMYLV